MENKIIEYYSKGIEKNRLNNEYFKLEGTRTKEIVSRYLTDEKMKIADIGGGAGFYAFWLQEMGHEVSLVDLSTTNIELANSYSAENNITLNNCINGDATALEFEDEQFDLVLLFGPLYHLINKNDRVKALKEAKRVLKTGGIVLSVVISRYASLFDGFKRDLINDPQFEKLLIDDLNTGIHLNETDNLIYFTTSYFHTPGELKNEIIESGLHFDKLIAIESFGWIVDNYMEKSLDTVYMNKLNSIIHMVEDNIELMAMSPHIMGVAAKY